MSSLSIRLFRNVGVELNNYRISKFRTTKVLALLIYLAAQRPIIHQREALMTLLWPDQEKKAAQTNLRQILYQLRKAIPEVCARENGRLVPFILCERKVVQVNPQADIEVDALTFSALWEAVEKHEHNHIISCPRCLNRLEAAVELYQGPYLADFFLNDSNRFEDWAQRRRSCYHRQVMNALFVLAVENLRFGRYDKVQSYAHQQLDLDNMDERAIRQLMQALAFDGRRPEALSVYEEAAQRFDKEYGVQPSDKTQQLARQIAGILR